MKGYCLCQQVTIEAIESEEFVVCHCSQCRRWGGGPILSVDCSSKVAFTGEALISRYQSSEWAQRGFCGHCGTHLFYYLIASKEYFLPVGLFQEKKDFVFKREIFIDSKPDYYQFANNTETLTQQQLFENFGLNDE